MTDTNARNDPSYGLTPFTTQVPSGYYIPPNYFYYYKQTSAASGQAAPCCGSPGFDWRGSRTLVPPSPYFSFWVEIAKNNARDGKEIPVPGANAGQTLSYIDLFAWALRHEKSHHDSFHEWWPDPLLYSETLDADHDVVRDSLEPTLAGGPYDPTRLDSYPEDPLSDDDERYTCVTAQPWDKNSAKREDWAYPGTNYH